MHKLQAMLRLLRLGLWGVGGATIGRLARSRTARFPSVFWAADMHGFDGTTAAIGMDFSAYPRMLRDGPHMRLPERPL